MCTVLCPTVTAQEKVFAQYFDIPVNSPEGTEVIGRIHLERNKDVLTHPIPALSTVSKLPLSRLQMFSPPFKANYQV